MRVARAGLPVDPALVHSGLELAQRFKRRPFAANPPRNQPELGIAQERLQGGRAHRRDIGPDPHAAINRAARLPCAQPQRAGPAQPQLLKVCGAAPARAKLDPSLPHRVRAAHQRRPGKTAGQQPGIAAQRAVGPAAPAAAEPRPHVQPPRLADLNIGQQRYVEPSSAPGQQRIEHHQGQHQAAQQRRSGPAARHQHRQQQGRRGCRRNQQRRAAGRHKERAGGHLKTRSISAQAGGGKNGVDQGSARRISAAPRSRRPDRRPALRPACPRSQRQGTAAGGGARRGRRAP